jgi:2-iminobutanoate/2-iminopropanoate deaminase
MKTIIRTDHAPAPIGPYSQAVQAGGFLFCSGQIPIDPKTSQLVLGPVDKQADLVMTNIKAVLEKAGLNMNHIVKTTIFLTNMNDFTAVNEVYGRYITENPPARSTVAVAALPKGVNVEIEVTARYP